MIVNLTSQEWACKSDLNASLVTSALVTQVLQHPLSNSTEDFFSHGYDSLFCFYVWLDLVIPYLFERHYTSPRAGLMPLWGSAQLRRSFLRRSFSFSLLSGSKQTFGEKTYFCTRGLDMFPETFLDIDAAWPVAFCFHATKFSFPPVQGSCAQTAYGKDPWPM